MSPDLDAGLLRGVDGSRVAGLGGHGDRHSHRPADYSCLETETDYSPNSDASSSHVSYPSAHHDAVPAASHHPLDSSNRDDDSYKSRRSLQAAHPRPSQLPFGEDVNGRPSAPHALPRSNLRSASSPLDSKSSVSGPSKTPTGKPSVKDLKKRFDQNGGATTVSKPQVRLGNPPRSTRPMVKTANRTPVHSDSRAASSQDSRAASSQDSRAASSQDAQVQAAAESDAATRPQRSKFVAQAAVPGSSQSFASRIGKPRNSIFGKVPGSKSMTQLPHRGPHPQLSSSPPTTSRPSGLLFGEIPPGQRGTAVAGFGIHDTRPRRTSEASSYNLASHNRSLSGPDAEQPLPSSWYRHVDAATGAHQRLRNRSRSDAAASPASIELEISYNPPHRFPASMSPDPSSSASKLPVSVRKLSCSTNLTSPASTRSNSPSALKCSLASARVSGANTGATSRATSTDIRAKTPTQTGRKPPPQALATPDNGRLQAYIAVPSPKLSPPLRSSRPRLPISTATAVGLRIKEGRARSRDRLAPNGTKTDNGAARRRKISFGPIDFEQRREHIRLAYSKSIRESEALEERQIAAERRRRESEEVTKAIVSTEAITSPSAEAATAASPSVAETESETEMAFERRQQALSSKRFESESSIGPAERSIIDPAPDPVARPSIPPLTVHTALDSAPPPSIDSPTLGVPGSFPVLSPPATTDEQPLSAVSGISETTEFDVEPQTNPPIQAHSPLDVPITVVKPPSPERSAPAPQSEYQYPFEDETEFREQPSNSSGMMQEPVQAEDARDIGNVPSVGRAVGHELVEPEPSRGAVVAVVSPTEETGSVEPHSTIPFPRLDAQDESDCHSDLEPAAQGSYDSRHDDDGATDACTEETDDGYKAGYRRSDFRLDELSSHRTSTCASSDAGALDDIHEPAHDRSQGMAGPSSLAVPPSRLQNDRFSQQSAWTDFSVDSMDASDNAKSPAMQSRQGSPSFGHVTIFGSRATARESASSSKDTASGMGLHMPDEPKRSSMPVGQTQLPEVDTGGGFFVPSLSPSAASASLSFLPSPNHEPPPVPVSASASALNSTRSSVFYDQPPYGGLLITSERGADDFTSPLETPQSLDVALTEIGDQFFRGHTAADGSKSLAQVDDGKERHRLIQRHNVIRELIDTEAVFVRDMNIVEEIYKGTAEACPKLDSKTVKLIFRNSDEIIQFHTNFLKGLKGAVASVYVPVGGRSSLRGEDSAVSGRSQRSSGDPRDSHDRATSLGPVFQHNVESMKLAHEGFLRNSDQAAKRLIQIQQDPTVQVWLNECNEVAKDLTAAWDLDSLLIKPMQRITKYPNLIMTLLQHTPHEHPDREALLAAKDSLETAIVEINRTKKNFELVGQIVGRKRKESDVKAGFARAFGKRVDKLQASNNRPPEDQDYVKLHEKFGDDYLRLQVVLRDVEFYTRQVSAYVHEFLQYLSSVELVMRLQPGNYPELESKWVQFNISVRDLEKVALEEHLLQVRKHVIEPFELVIKAYGNPSLAMKKRQKRRLDYERSEQLKRAGRTADPKLRELVEQYEALNDTLKKELPALSGLTEKVGNICLGNFVNIQTDWFAIWKEKMRTVLGDCPEMPDLEEVVSTFQRDYPYARDQLAGIGILNPTSRGRLSQSTASMDDSTIRSRGREVSDNGDAAPTLPAPDFGGRGSGSFSMSASPSVTGLGVALSSPHHYYYRDYYAGIHAHQGAPPSSSRSPDMVGSSRSLAGTGAASTRPSTGRSLDSGGAPRQSSESTNQHRRDSNTTYNSSHPPYEGGRYSNIFHSALPLPDGPEDSRRSSRASSRERNRTSDGYNILWLAASLFEFNISTTKHEAGYPYLTYQAGEIFDVIAEKGELWLAKNQDDATDQVGWIWSKHFAKLADS